MRFGKIGLRPLFADLPYDAEVEWLEKANMDNYIDTGIYLRWNDIIDADIINTANNTTEFWNEYYLWTVESMSNTAVTCGGRRPPKTMGHVNFYGFRKNGIGVQLNFQGTYGATEHLHIESGNSYLGSSKDMSNWGELGICDLPLRLFARYRYYNSEPTMDYMSKFIGNRIRTFTVTRDGKKIIDLMAVRVSNVGYMYDRVSRKLFGNAGTGSFIVGPDRVTGGN